MAALVAARRLHGAKNNTSPGRWVTRSAGEKPHQDHQHDQRHRTRVLHHRPVHLVPVREADRVADHLYVTSGRERLRGEQLLDRRLVGHAPASAPAAIGCNVGVGGEVRNGSEAVGLPRCDGIRRLSAV